MQTPWYRNPAFLHGLEQSLTFLAGLASLGVGGRVVQIAGKAAVTILAETQPVVEPPARLKGEV